MRPVNKTTEDLLSPSIPTNYSRLIARSLGLNEKNLAEILVGTGISTKEFLRDDTRLTGLQQIQLFSNAQRLSKVPHLGLQFGQRVTPSTHGAIGFLVNSSPTLLDALNAFRDFLPLRMHLTQFTIGTDANWLSCNLHVHPEVPQHLHRLFLEVLCLAIYAITESTLGQPPAGAELYLTYPEPEYGARYREIMACNIHFGAAENCLKIPKNLASVTNISADQHSYEIAQRQCKELSQHFYKDLHTTKSQVRRLLLSIPNHQISSQEVASAMFISGSTLSRRLADEGTSFREIRDEVLSSLAAGYLKNSQLSIEAISSLLNYHDSSNFRRAFKRWFQITPDQYRKNYSNQKSDENI